MKLGRLLMIGAIAASLAVLLALAAAPAAAQDNSSPRVFPPGSSPYGKSYVDWSAQWWTWALSGTSDENPTTDPDGHLCNTGQPQDVFFLTSNFGDTTVRTCTVPATQGLLLSPGGVICVLHIDGETEEELRACAEEAIAPISNLAVDIDGRAISGIADYYATSMFDLTLPADNVLGVPAGEHQALGAGYFLLLEPLPAGEHEVHLHDEFPEGFVSDVTYRLTVEAAPAETPVVQPTATAAPSQLPSTGTGARAENGQWALLALLFGTGVLLLASGMLARARR